MATGNVPPPRPPPAAVGNIFDSSNQLMGTGQYLGGFQTAPFMGMSTPGYGIYNRMNMLGGGMVGYGSPESNFIRLAEESSRGAFQSIESVVNAVGSVANMLSSMHSAVFNSFRAVIGVVDQLRLFKQQASYVFLTVLHFLRVIWRKLLIWLHLRPKNFANSDNVWSSIIGANSENTVLDQKSPIINCAAICFWIVALGGPYLVYKCVSQMIERAEQSRKWATGNDEHYTAQALYNFDASNNQELSFRANDMLRVAPKSQQPKVRDWVLASTEDGERIGLVPITYIKLINRTSSPPVQPERASLAVMNSSSDLNAIYNSTFKNAFT